MKPEEIAHAIEYKKSDWPILLVKHILNAEILACVENASTRHNMYRDKDARSGLKKFNELFLDQDSAQLMKIMFRMTSRSLKCIANLLRKRAGLQDLPGSTVEMRLAAFLLVWGKHYCVRDTAMWFYKSKSTISDWIGEILDALVVVHTRFVSLPQPPYSSRW